MLIIYRTNAGFEGQIVTVDLTQPKAAFDAYVAQAAPPVYMAALELDEKLLPDALHVGLLVNRDAYRVVDGGLQKDGAEVTLGYTPGDADVALANLRADAIIQSLLIATPSQLSTWIAGRTTAQALLVILQVLQYILRAARLMAD